LDKDKKKRREAIKAAKERRQKMIETGEIVRK
jgi:hypothetical protein